GEKRPTAEKVLLHLAKRILEAAMELKSPEGSKKGLRSIWQIIYQLCPKCFECHVHTKDGPVEVPLEHVRKIEAEAEKVTIEPHELLKGEALPSGKVNDEPVPAGVERKVLARYRNSCAICGRRGHLHLHHIIFRSKGGGNEVWNLAPACPACHA